MSLSQRLVHVANSSNKNIRIGKWLFPARRIIAINGVDESLKSTFQHYISEGSILVTGDFREAILYLKTVKPKINIDAILGRPPLPKEVIDAQQQQQQKQKTDTPETKQEAPAPSTKSKEESDDDEKSRSRKNRRKFAKEKK